MTRLKAIIIEDEPLVAEDIAGCIEALGYEVGYIAYSAEDAVISMQNTKYDFALIDITLAGKMDGIELAMIINEEHKFPFLFLTSHSDRSILERAKKARPSAYLLKPFDENDLMTSLEVAIFNHINPKESVELSLDEINKQVSNPISDREFEIIKLLRKGNTNQEIAEHLFVSINTIKTHLTRLYVKLDASNRTEALFRIDSILKS